MWAVWALIGTFSFSAPWAARGGSSLSTGAFTVCLLELPVLFHPTRQKALRMGQVSFSLFSCNVLVERDIIGFELISITLFELLHYAKCSSLRFQN